MIIILSKFDEFKATHHYLTAKNYSIPTELKEIRIIRENEKDGRWSKPCQESNQIQREQRAMRRIELGCRSSIHRDT